MKYAKPALSVEQQADQLIQRGLIADRDLLIERLRVVSYYRLSGYWYTFRKPDPGNPQNYLDDLKTGTNFDTIWNRYVFDRHLRFVVMDAVERIEVAARTAIAYHHAQAHGSFAYATNPASLPGISKKERDQLLGSIQREKTRSKERFVRHFQSKYGSHHSDLPIWMAIEIMSFGSVLTMYCGCSPAIRQAVAKPLGVHDAVFESWLLTLNTVRNICAHHGRLWNREIGTKPKIPKKDPNWHTPVEVGNSRMFGVLSICKWSLDRIAPQSRWADRLRALLADYPDIPLVSMDFPANWQDSPIWSDATQQQDLHDIATKVRDALQKLSADRHPLVLRIENAIGKCRPDAPVTFPRNWCDYASCVLALQLARYLEDSTVELCKWDEEGVLHSHWWLRHAGFDIDITADQYEHTTEPVIVERDSQTHQTHFHDPSVRPFFSRERQQPYFELLVDRLDADVDRSLSHDRAAFMATRYMGEGVIDDD